MDTVRFRIVRIVALSGVFLALPASGAIPGTPGRVMIHIHPFMGAKCIDVPYAQFVRGMRVQTWTCNNVITWGQPNSEVTLGIVRKTGKSEIRVRLGETPIDPPAAQAFLYDEQSQQIKTGNLCLESWGRGEPQDAVGLGACGAAPNQQWKAVPSGQYQQIIGAKGLCLETRNGASDNGAPLDLTECGAGKPQQLWTFKSPTRAVLGVRWRKPTDQEASSLGLEPAVGIIVEQVLEGGPTEKSGLVSSDAIISVNGQPINGAAIAPGVQKSSGGCSRYMPSVGLTVRVPCDEYLGESK